MNSRVLVLGLDGADWSILRPLLPRLPNLSGLVGAGASGPLRSTLLPITPPAWSTFLTGRNPGAHGVFDHLKRKQGSYDLEPVHRGHLGVPALWDLLAAAGVPQVWVNVPMSWPPPGVDGVVVSGWPAWPGSPFTWPPNLQKRLEARLGDYPLHAEEVAHPGRRERFLAGQERVVRQRARALLLALEEVPDWRFAMLHFEAPDETHHGCYGDPVSIERIYRVLDSAIGEVLRRVPRETRIVVASDHGAAPLRWFLHLNPWLRERGLLHLRRGPATALKSALSSAGLAPASVYRLMLRGGLGGLRRLLPPAGERGLLSRLFLSFRDVEWDRTLAYSVGYGGQLYLNRRGREPRGAVREEEAGDVLARIEAGLWLLRDPQTGRPLVTEVLQGREIYSGPRASEAPDLVFLTDGMATVGFGRFEFASPRPLARPFGIRSSHSMEGVLAMAGPDIAPGGVSADLRDCAPTILSLLGLGVPEEMEGRPLAAGGGTAAPAAAAPAPVATADHPAVLERLRRLGYLG